MLQQTTYRKLRLLTQIVTSLLVRHIICQPKLTVHHYRFTKESKNSGAVADKEELYSEHELHTKVGLAHEDVVSSLKRTPALKFNSTKNSIFLNHPNLSNF
jgi:hypothetical protein